MNPRRWLLRSFIIFAMFILGSALQGLAVTRPNILVILADDQGYPDLGCMGLKDIQTPNLDRLASEGVRATNFYVTWPACTPSRGSILTGRYPQRNGLYDMIRNDLVNYGYVYTPEEYALSPEMTLGLDVREVTIANALKQAGYACGAVGKWDSGRAKRFLPRQRGFDFFYGFANTGIDYYTHERYGVPSMLRGNQMTEADKGTYATDVFKREGLRFLDQNREQPFFLYMAFNAPHSGSSFDKNATRPGATVGVQAPEKYIRMYPKMDPKARVTAYYAAVTCMDDAVGELLQALKAAKLEDNTLVIFFSDNGGAGNGGNAPLRGAKGTMWEGGVRVPFIARWPGRIPAGKVTDEFITSLELFPTFTKLAGVENPKGVVLDGFDMLPVLEGKAKSPRTEMYWERRSDRAARVGNWKWVDSTKGGGLFDLSTDIGEKHDLSKEKPEALAMVKARFDAWRKQMDEAEPHGPFRDY